MFTWLEHLSDVPGDEWHRLWSLDARPNPFMAASFLSPWQQTFAAANPLRIGLWSVDERLRGLIFLYEVEGRWELLGGQDVSDRLSPLVEPGLHDRFWAEFLDSFPDRPLVLPNQMEGESSLRLPFAQVEQTDRSPYLALPASFDEYLASLSKKQRHELQRKLRRAERFEPNLSVTSSLGLDEFLRLHRMSHPEKELFMQGPNAIFFARLWDSIQPQVDFLLADGVPIAAMFQILCQRRTFLYNSGFDPRFREMAPGVVLLSHCIRAAIERGDVEFDFLRGQERYKYDLGAHDRGVYRVRLDSTSNSSAR